MLQSRATHLVVANLLVQLGQPLPKALVPQLPLVAAVPETHVVLGVHWVEGVPGEPSGWEILTSPAYLFELVAKTEFPELVFRAVQLLLALGNVKTDVEKKAMVAEAYEGLSSEEQTAFQKILNDIDTVRRKLGDTMDATTTAVWVRPELVSASLRRMTVEQGASIYVARRQLESKTILETEKLLEDDEESEETPGEGTTAEASTTAAVSP